MYSRTSKTILDKKDSPDSAHVPATQSAKTESKTMLESPRVLLPPKVSEDIINLDPKTDARPRPPVEVKKPPAVSKGEAHNLEFKSSESEESDEEKTDEDDLENIGTRTASAKGDEQREHYSTDKGFRHLKCITVLTFGIVIWNVSSKPLSCGRFLTFWKIKQFCSIDFQVDLVY